MEKPMGLKYDDVESLTKDFDNVRLQPGFIELYNPVFQELKDCLAKKKIGEILNISSKRVGLFPRRYWGMGVVMDLTTHDLYLHQDLLGEVKDIKSMVRYFHDKKFEDAAYVLLDFGESKSMIESNWITPTKYRKMFVSGEDGTIEIDFISRELKLLTGNDLTGDKPEIIETKYKQLRSKEPLREELMDFLYSDKPKITLKDGLSTLDLVLKVLEAAKK
jgi:UDP-N-acetylglucosamine 3-dehydrogenase